MDEQTFTISNPRREDTFQDWPHGRRQVTAKFNHETKPKRGERIGRTTTGKPKYSTYYDSIRLVDGTDGNTHMVADCGSHVTVLSCNMQHQDFCVFPRHENYEAYLAMARS